MTARMTNLSDDAPSNEDDLTPIPDDGDGDTSFEIDEPDDEEVIDNMFVISKRTTALESTITKAAGATVALNNQQRANDLFTDRIAINEKSNNKSTISIYTSPFVSKNDDPGEQSDSSNDSHTGSSTPTTADVADIAAEIVSPYTHRVNRLSPPQHSKLVMSQNSQRIITKDSIAEDNISGSIATTTTETDLDGIASVSPNVSARKNLRATPSSAFRSTDARKNREDFSQTDVSKRSSGTLQSSSSPPQLEFRDGRGFPFFNLIRCICGHFKSSGIGEPSVYHALVVIFLEFFAWGLLTMPVIAVLNQTFPDHTFLMNGLVMGIKGILSFLSAPLIGALSDIWGRKFFLLITVFFTCVPIPLMTINTWWFFAMISISGVFAVTFSVVFAYVADVTTVEERSRAYGLVSATFAASLVISPALGAALMEMYSDTLVVALATAIAVLDVFFILVAVPESLPEKVRPSSWGAPISWEQADPFAALRKVGTDHTVLMLCVTVLLSYLPEAGQYSCIFVYLKLKMDFNSMEVAIFIAVVGILSISVQVTLGYLMRVFGAKHTIILGLILEMMQLLWYGFGSQAWMMWAAGVLAALGSITYPAISAFVSIHSSADKQGAVQGMVTGMRGLCNGLGPAMFGVIFYLFNVDLNDAHDGGAQAPIKNQTSVSDKYIQLVPGPPFVFGALMVLLAIFVAIFIPESHGETSLSRAPSEKKRNVSL